MDTAGIHDSNCRTTGTRSPNQTTISSGGQMNPTLKIVILVIVLIATLLTATSVKAYDPDALFSKAQTITGHKAHTIHEGYTPHPHDSQTAQPKSKLVVLMQDLTQCKLTDNGQ